MGVTSLSGDPLWDVDYYPGDMTQSQASSPVSSSWSFSPTYHDYSTAPMPNIQTELPFSVKYSAKVCLRAALAMSHIVQVLPNQNSFYMFADDPSIPYVNSPWHKLSPFSHLLLAMPSFASCLTQGSYIMSTICYKARMAQRVYPELDLETCGSVAASDQLVEQLKKGLQCIIASMAQHAVAFEAMRSIRGPSLSFNTRMQFHTDKLLR